MFTLIKANTVQVSDFFVQALFSEIIGVYC